MARGRKDYEKSVVAVESEGFTNPHGRILMHDDFEDTPLKWFATGSGMHSETRQHAATYNGSFGLQLDVTATAPPTDNTSYVYRYIPIDVTERLLLELFWRANHLSRMMRLDVYLAFYDGANWHNTALRYERATASWQYWSAAPAWTAVPGGAQTFYNGAWNELTLSVDFLADEYILFKSNNLEVNMGGLGCPSPVSGVGAHAVITLMVHNDTANQLLVSIDDVIIRELEA